MCIGICGITSRARIEDPYVLSGHPSHSDIKKEFSLADTDDAPGSRTGGKMVPWEFKPPAGPLDFSTTDPDKWTFEPDFQGELPSWWTDQLPEIESAARCFLESEIDKIKSGTYLGDINLSGTAITSFSAPALKECSGYIDLSGTAIKNRDIDIPKSMRRNLITD